MPNMLDRKNSLLLVVDVQEKLVNMLDKNIVVSRTATLVKAAKIMEIPTIVTEQYPKGLGGTVEQVKQSLPVDAKIIEKSAFSAFKENGFSIC